MNNQDEFNLNTDPNLADTDNDGLSDEMEINTYSTDPLSTDTDGDGLNDGLEINYYNSNPLDSDTDNDGLTDGDEYSLYGTSPIDNDSDDDGLTDGLEVGISDPNIFDWEYNSNSCSTKDGSNTYTSCSEIWQPDEDELTMD